MENKKTQNELIEALQNYVSHAAMLTNYCNQVFSEFDARVVEPISYLKNSFAARQETLDRIENNIEDLLAVPELSSDVPVLHDAETNQDLYVRVETLQLNLIERNETITYTAREVGDFDVTPFIIGRSNNKKSILHGDVWDEGI